MKPLILHPTDMSQWYTLVCEAQASTNLLLNENIESYLVFLLMRFSQTTQLIESIMALDFLEAMHLSEKQQIKILRDIGDKNLLFCGLFPGMALKHHVGIDYFRAMGQAAYLSASELEYNSDAILYAQLSTQFIKMQQILQAMSGFDTKNFKNTPLINPMN